MVNKTAVGHGVCLFLTCASALSSAVSRYARSVWPSTAMLKASVAFISEGAHPGLQFGVIGQRRNGSNGDAALTVTVNGISDPWEGFEEFDAPARGTRYVLLDVTVVNNTPGVVSASPGDFSATDDQGFLLENAFASTESIGLPSYDYIDLQPGAEQRGSIVFQVFADLLKFHTELFELGFQGLALFIG